MTNNPFTFLVACALAVLFIACEEKNKNADPDNTDKVVVQQYQQGKSMDNTDYNGLDSYVPGADSVDFEPTTEKYNQLMNELADSLKAMDPNEIRSIMEEAIEEMQQVMPVEAVYGLTYTDAQITDNAVVYHLVCDENVWNMDEVENKKNELGEEFMMGDSESPENAVLQAMCKAVHCNVEFYLTGQQSGKTTHIVLTY